METVSQTAQKDEQDGGQAEGMSVPENFSELLMQEDPDEDSRGEFDTPPDELDGLTENQKAVQKASERILEKASVMVHRAFDKSMKAKGRPGLREMPPDEMGKILVMGLPDKLKQQHPLVVYMGMLSGVLADNFVLSVPDEKQEPEPETDGE